jgi:ComF family protein
MRIISFIDDLSSLFFPRSCEICGNVLYRNEELICLHCLGHLPYTHWHQDPENPLHAVFWGKMKIEGVSALLYFHHGNRTQKLLHKLKYKGVKELGEYIGKRYGNQLIEAYPFRDADVIIPVPLHPKKMKSRGYNQSEAFANGLSQSMHIPVDTKHLYRKIASSTQTKKSKIERWENVKSIFAIKKPEELIGKHVLLVDDVITTGSTLEACGAILLQIPNLKLSLASIAAAHR